MLIRQLASFDIGILVRTQSALQPLLLQPLWYSHQKQRPFLQCLTLQRDGKRYHFSFEKHAEETKIAVTPVSGSKDKYTFVMAKSNVKVTAEFVYKGRFLVKSTVGGRVVLANNTSASAS